jgi:hypothetical protein
MESEVWWADLLLRAEQMILIEEAELGVGGEGHSVAQLQANHWKS